MFPSDIDQLIFNLLSIEDVCRCTRVCKRWKSEIDSDSVWRWRDKLQLDIKDLKAFKNMLIEKEVWIKFFREFIEHPKSDRAQFLESILDTHDMTKFNQCMAEFKAKRGMEPAEVAERIFRIASPYGLLPSVSHFWRKWIEFIMLSFDFTRTGDRSLNFVRAMEYPMYSDIMIGRVQAIRYLMWELLYCDLGIKNLDISENTKGFHITVQQTLDLDKKLGMHVRISLANFYAPVPEYSTLNIKYGQEYKRRKIIDPHTLLYY